MLMISKYIVSSFLIKDYSFSRKILYNLILWVIHMSEKYNKNTLVFVKDFFITYLEIRILVLLKSL